MSNPAENLTVGHHPNGEDTVGQFIEAEIERMEGSFAKSADLHQRFIQWAERNGRIPWTQRLLIKELRGRGFTDGRGTGGVRGLRGLRLR